MKIHVVVRRLEQLHSTHSSQLLELGGGKKKGYSCQCRESSYSTNCKLEVKTSLPVYRISLIKFGWVSRKAWSRFPLQICQTLTVLLEHFYRAKTLWIMALKKKKKMSFKSRWLISNVISNDFYRIPPNKCTIWSDAFPLPSFLILKNIQIHRCCGVINIVQKKKHRGDFLYTELY